LLDELSPPAERLDVKSDLSAGFPYRLPHASHVAELLANLIQPRSAKKGLITDLDDTVWRGILGEDGVQGISWDLEGRSHIHGLYQQLLAALAESGVLLAVASRNDPDLVQEAMRREDILLPPDRLFPLEINWGQKSLSIGKILKDWNVGAEAVVFVDDSPLELAEVKALYPEIECQLFPKNDDQAAYQLLRTLRDRFGKDAILEEDALRVESLKAGKHFKDQVGSEHSLEEFLKQVEAKLTFGPIYAMGETRAFELINKTNQFNLNGHRLIESEFRAALDRPGAVSLLVSYRDKFGALGKIAVMLGWIKASVLTVDAWVMSCRAFGRQIEHKCLDYLFEQWNLEEINLDYHHTERNEPLRAFLSQFSDEPASSPIKIQRDVFMSRKPRLFQSVNGGEHA
jgi:FkbH-like protein